MSDDLPDFLFKTLDMVFPGLLEAPLDVQKEFASLMQTQILTSDESAFLRNIFQKKKSSMPPTLESKLHKFITLASFCKGYA
jgi:hypothetical protein